MYVGNNNGFLIVATWPTTSIALINTCLYWQPAASSSQIHVLFNNDLCLILNLEYEPLKIISYQYDRFFFLIRGTYLTICKPFWYSLSCSCWSKGVGKKLNFLGIMRYIYICHIYVYSQHDTIVVNFIWELWEIYMRID